MTERQRRIGIQTGLLVIGLGLFVAGLLANINDPLLIGAFVTFTTLTFVRLSWQAKDRKVAEASRHPRP